MFQIRGSRQNDREESLSYFGNDQQIKSSQSPSSKFHGDSGSTQNIEKEVAFEEDKSQLSQGIPKLVY